MQTTIRPIELGSLQLPDWHPRAEDGEAITRAFVIEHPDGVILVDTGVGQGNKIIEEMYQPTIRSIVDVLHESGIDERDVVAIVNTHLHFDHCGQNSAFPTVPVWVQAADHALVDQPGFTVPDWAHVPEPRLRLIDGDADLVVGVRIIATPGHTPGHQSVVVDAGGSTTVVAGQCCYTCAEFESGVLAAADMHAEHWIDRGRVSLDRLRALSPDVVHFSHDRMSYRRET